MNKKICALLFCAVMSVLTAAAQTLTEQAEAAYNNDDYNKALQLYQQAAKDEGTSSELFYNIGNVYYKLDKNGMAILYYERALLLDPNNQDARNNLDFVNGKANLSIDRGSTYWKDSLDEIVRSQSASTWGKIGIICFFAFIVAVAVYIFMNAVIVRRARIRESPLLLWSPDPRNPGGRGRLCRSSPGIRCEPAPRAPGASARSPPRPREPARRGWDACSPPCFRRKRPPAHREYSSYTWGR